MIVFKTIKYKNFLAAGNNEIIIDFDAAPTTLIIGKNGVGKSQLIDSLSFVLFNKAHRKLNRPQLINSINNKNCLVTVEFEIGPNQYKVVRGMKPNVFEIWVNGSLINQDSHSRDYQAILETNILKFNHKSFHQVVVLGAGNYIPFMMLPTWHRRSVIEDLLDIGIFTKMNVALKESSAKQKEALKDIEHHINLLTEKIKLQTKHLNELQSIGERNTGKIRKEITELESDIDRINLLNDGHKQAYDASYNKLKKNLAAATKELEKLTSFEHGIKFNINKIVTEAKFYEENTECPTCSQAICEHTRSKKIADCKSRATKLNEGYTELNTSLTDKKNLVKTLQNELNELTKIPTLIQSNNNIIESHNARIHFLNDQVKAHLDSKELNKAKADLEKTRDAKLTMSELRLTQIEERTYSEVIAELLKDTGIKTKIIKQYLPVMNKLINSYLQTLDFFVSFHLDENFDETIKSRHRDDFSYASFSEGERARINLALLFAWRHIAHVKNSASTNLLILDEVMDSSLDSEGIDSLMQILSTLDPSTRTFIISHKQEFTDNKFDRCLVFDKVKNFSTYKSM
jgi:DNA repair exonuclease SbcCD ATPase subunit